MVEDKTGSIWAGGAYGFARFESGKWRLVGPELGFPAPGVQVLYVDRRGSLWVVTDGLDFGLSKDLVRRNTILTLASGTTHFAATGDAVGQVLMMAEAPGGGVWITDTSGGTVRPIKGQSAGKTAIAVGGESRGLLFDGASSLWIGLVEGGLRRVADLGNPTGFVVEQIKGGEGFSGALGYSAFKDREGDLWFGTGGAWSVFARTRLRLSPRARDWYPIS